LGDKSGWFTHIEIGFVLVDQMTIK
jgi:hypothetical protein